MKEKFETPELEIIRFSSSDVIATSNTGDTTIDSGEGGSED